MGTPALSAPRSRRPLRLPPLALRAQPEPSRSAKLRREREREEILAPQPHPEAQPRGVVWRRLRQRLRLRRHRHKPDARPSMGPGAEEDARDEEERQTRAEALKAVEAAAEATEAAAAEMAESVAQASETHDEPAILPDNVLSEARARRRRLNSRLGTSLRAFRDDVLDEVETQTTAAKERQSRYKRKQAQILESLNELRDDILSDIEVTIDGFVRGGKRVERGLRGLREEWEAEVDALIADAVADVNLAVKDVEQAIEAQRAEIRQRTELFNSQWISQGRSPSVNGSVAWFGSVNASRPPAAVSLAKYFEEIQENIRTTEADLEDDLREFKQRWAVTATRLEGLPQELPRLRTLADVRAFVADTIFEGGNVPLLQPRRQRRERQRIQREIEQEAASVGVPLVPPSTGDLNDPLGVRLVEASKGDVLRPTPDSDLRNGGRRIAVVTTAALPWMTGTAVNPLLRAAYLSNKGYEVTLLLPWLPREQQEMLFPRGLIFERPSEQEQYSRWWLANRANVQVSSKLKIRWYPGFYEDDLGAIIQRGDVDLARLVPENERDVVILEEPEHLNWYHHGAQWPHLFRHVVGVAHTNYLQYARFNNEGNVPGTVKEQWMRGMNRLVCAAYADVVVKLSATLEDVPGHNLVCNVHGVRGEFLAVGAQAATDAESGGRFFDSGAYFLGKALWTKGYRELLDNLAAHAAAGGEPLPQLHTYGSGPDEKAIRAEVAKLGVDVLTHEGIDHAHPSMHGYAVFVNPSTSDVLCTATAEALAMGKRVIIPDHPSNTFFKQFSNTMMYSLDRPEEMGELLLEALATPPVAMSAVEQYALSWEAATERLLDAAALPAGTRRPKERPLHLMAYMVHWSMGAGPMMRFFRAITGASPPQNVSDEELQMLRWPRELSSGGDRSRNSMSVDPESSDTKASAAVVATQIVQHTSANSEAEGLSLDGTSTRASDEQLEESDMKAR